MDFRNRLYLNQFIQHQAPRFHQSGEVTEATNRHPSIFLFLLTFLHLFPALLLAQSGNKGLLSFQQLTDSTIHYFLQLGDNEKAIPFAKPRRDSIRQRFGAGSLEFANACRSLGDMLARSGRYEEAEASFQLALQLADSLLPEGDSRMTTYFSTYGYCQMLKGEYRRALPFLQLAMKRQALNSHSDSVAMAALHLRLGTALYYSGEFPTSEFYLEKAKNWYSRVYGEKSVYLYEVFETWGNFYSSIGNYQKAIEQYKLGQGLLSFSDYQSKNWIIFSKKNIASNFYFAGKLDSALVYAQSALDDLSGLIATNNEKKKTMDVILQEGLNRKLLGAIYHKGNLLNQAESELQSAMQQLALVYKENDREFLGSKLNLALVWIDLGKYQQADSLLTQMENQVKDNPGTGADFPQKIIHERLRMAMARGRRQEALQHIDSLEQNILQQLDAIFLNFAATENEAFLLSLEEYRSWISGLLAAEAERNAAMASRLLDVHLNLHGILLSSERSVLQALRRQNEPVMAQKAETWFALRKQLAALQADGKIKADSLSAFEEKVNSLEKELIRQRSNRKGGFSANTRPGAEIQKTLKKGQAAVQIIRVAMPGMVSVQDRSDSLHRRYVYPEITDTIHYLALIIKPGTAHPALVSLRRGNWLERQGLANYRNQIRRQQEDPLSYGLFWQAIDSALGPEVKEVFYCPDGVYHSLNPASVLVPGKGRYLSGLRSWVRLTRLADLNEPAPERNNQKQAVLIGAPAFADGYRLSAGEEEQSRFEPLPGTLAEVNSVNQAMQKSGWKTSCFTGTTASEEAVKNLRSPAVLHLATHGYFRQDTLGGSHAMLSSGLILAGPDKAYPTDSCRREDGILKAREAQTLDLEGTDLVVLSACETGLGTSQNGEGMYGLQRAFQLAGCRRVLMSLWKIDDEATSRLMKAFYKFYLPSGNAQDALLKAQAELRKSYPHPYHWASFLVMGR